MSAEAAGNHSLYETLQNHHGPRLALLATEEVEGFLGARVQEEVVAATVPTEYGADPPPKKKAIRRRNFRVRRRRHGSKVYKPEPRSHLTGSTPHLHVVLPAAALDGVEPSGLDPDEAEAFEEETDHLARHIADSVSLGVKPFFISTEPIGEHVAQPAPDPLDAVDPDILALFEQIDEGIELPLGVYPEYGSGQPLRQPPPDSFLLGTVTEPDWGDPDHWDDGRYEPKQLPVRG